MEVHLVVFLPIAAALFSNVACVDENLTNLWNKHMKYTNSFTCEVPQPKAVHTKEIINSSKLVDYNTEYIFPSSTVLYRCHSTGCCKSNQECLPSASEEVNLVFQIFPKSRRGSHRRFVEITATNHTQCSCQNTTNQPK